MARHLRLHEHFDRLVDRGKTQSWINNQREEHVVIWDAICRPIDHFLDHKSWDKLQLTQPLKVNQKVKQTYLRCFL